MADVRPHRSGRSRRPAGTSPARVRVLDGGEERSRDDLLATEEPLEIRVSAGGAVRTVGVTMRTPGADFELAAGFLRTEGIVGSRADIRRIDYCLDAARPNGDSPNGDSPNGDSPNGDSPNGDSPDRASPDGEDRFNIVTVRLAAASLPELSSLDRYGTISSACGVCGKATLGAVRARVTAPPPLPGVPVVDRDTLYRLPDALRAAQGNFAATGGLHAAGLFDPGGTALCVREDIGRHNAVDKVVGWGLLRADLPFAGCVLVVSGRAGFEIVQKAVSAGIPVVAAVSAPSSLAVDLAREHGLTLVGFLRGRGANVYAAPERVR